MHGLIFRTAQVFLQDTYGAEKWLAMVQRADLNITTFEAMLHYEADEYSALVSAAAEELKKPAEALLEDLGTYLVSHPNSEALRRLLRFGGVDFIEFLHSLDDLPDRAKLALSDLDLPDLELREFAPNNFGLQVTGDIPGFGHVVMGLLRAMADDYGVLALLDHEGAKGNSEMIVITVIETEYAQGRDFDLGAKPQPRSLAS
ncbi:MAG: heme NO-binding domain-containing protein [Paracoccaceae bacterium]|nr:heme NO-binding domain-containing protein [Paracoccaceae bacterium]